MLRTKFEVDYSTSRVDVRAPELFFPNKTNFSDTKTFASAFHTASIDVWSLGCILSQFFSKDGIFGIMVSFVSLHNITP